MDTYQIVLNAVFFLAGCGLSAWFAPWLIDRNAHREGFRLGWVASADAVDHESAFAPPVDLTERIKQYGSAASMSGPAYPTEPTNFVYLDTKCGHCGAPRTAQSGYGRVDLEFLCHPNEGRVDGGLPLDCYRLVTVYDHDMPCINCQTKNAAVDENAGSY